MALAGDIPGPVRPGVLVQVQTAEGNSDLDGPLPGFHIDLRGGLDCAVPELGVHEAVIRAIVVIPCAKGVDQEVVIVASLAGGVEEDFDAVIRPDRAVVVGDGGADTAGAGLVTFHGDIEELIVEGRLEPGLDVRGLRIAPVVLSIGGAGEAGLPVASLPDGVIEDTVHSDRRFCTHGLGGRFLNLREGREQRHGAESCSERDGASLEGHGPGLLDSR